MGEMIDASEAIMPTPPEALERLGPDQVEAISKYSVEKEKAETSDDQLWSKLFDVYSREVELKANIGVYCKLGNSKGKDRDFWHSTWMMMCAELAHKDEYIRLIGWHLSRRGHHDAVIQFLNERAEYEHDNRLSWVNTPDNPKAPTLHLIRGS